jgi:zinc D-Ala-D-Ala carboxypeptidase
VQLTANFTLEEFEQSETAVRMRLDNRVPKALLANAKATVEMLQGIRDYLSKVFNEDCPMILTSGYRCIELNRAKGSSDSSDHVQANAADWRVLRRFGSSMEICHILEDRIDELGIGQLINEYPTEGWIHTSRKPPTKAVNRVITITHAGTRMGITPSWA